MPEDDIIRPFTVGFPETALTDLRSRVNATRWPEAETVTDDSQGAPLAMMQDLARYWATDYDWRKCETRLNDLPHFITEIDGLDIHFLQVRSRHEDALPLIVTHGWPGSVIEQLKIIEPLTNPEAQGGSGADAFHLVIPSLPGHGFSAKPTATGWDPARIARAWVVLMKRLGYTRFVAQGGGWSRCRAGSARAGPPRTPAGGCVTGTPCAGITASARGRPASRSGWPVRSRWTGTAAAGWPSARTWRPRRWACARATSPGTAGRAGRAARRCRGLGPAAMRSEGVQSSALSHFRW